MLIMPPQDRVTLRDALRRLRDTPWIAEIPVGPSTIGQLVDANARFDWDGTHLRPMQGFGDAAAAVARTNPRLLDAVAGAIRHAGRFADDANPQLAPLVHGVSLAPNFEADVVQALATTMVDANWLPSTVRNDRDATELREMLEFQQGDPDADNGAVNRDGGSAQAGGRWLSIGFQHSNWLRTLSETPQLSTPRERSVAASLAGLFQHELAHLITSWRDGADQPSWLEEGTAELTTSSDERNFAAAAAMGWRTREPSRATGGYPAYERALTKLVRLSGVDPADDRAVTQLLQAPASGEVLPAIARSIVQHNGLRGFDADRVRIAVASLHDSSGDEDSATSDEPKAPHLEAAVARIARMVEGARGAEA